MARIRTIKPDFWTDETLTECSLSARLLFIGTWNFADDKGNLERSWKQLKMKVFPADDVKVASLLNELITHGLLIEYSVNDRKYLHIKGFEKHQVINRPSSSNIPAFDDSLITHGTLTEDSLREGKGREGKGKEQASASILGVKKLVELGVKEQHAIDWLKVRKAKRAPLTDTVIKSVASQAEQAGITFGEAIAVCAEKSWQGFNASWDWRGVGNGVAGSGAPKPKPCPGCGGRTNGGTTHMAIGDVCNRCYGDYMAGAWDGRSARPKPNKPPIL